MRDFCEAYVRKDYLALETSCDELLPLLSRTDGSSYAASLCRRLAFIRPLVVSFRKLPLGATSKR